LLATSLPSLCVYWAFFLGVPTTLVTVFSLLLLRVDCLGLAGGLSAGRCCAGGLVGAGVSVDTVLLLVLRLLAVFDFDFVCFGATFLAVDCFVAALEVDFAAADLPVALRLLLLFDVDAVCLEEACCVDTACCVGLFDAAFLASDCLVVAFAAGLVPVVFAADLAVVLRLPTVVDLSATCFAVVCFVVFAAARLGAASWAVERFVAAMAADLLVARRLLVFFDAVLVCPEVVPLERERGADLLFADASVLLACTAFLPVELRFFAADFAAPAVALAATAFLRAGARVRRRAVGVACFVELLRPFLLPAASAPVPSVPESFCGPAPPGGMRRICTATNQSPTPTGASCLPWTLRPI
jgi:hypothetical protein